MSLGPELIFQISKEITEEFMGNTIRRVEAFDRWLALFPARGRLLFLSWDPDFYGCCEATPGELQELASAAFSKPPILGAVKSHIAGTRLVSVLPLNRDRILRMEFRKTIGAGFHQTKYLLLEASGRYSNLLLLDDREKIVETAKHIYPESNRYRSLLPGYSYVLPPPAGETELEDFDPTDQDASEKLHSVKGIGKPLIDAILRTSNEKPERRGQIFGGLRLFTDTGAGENGKTPAHIYQSLGDYVTLYSVSLSGGKTLDTDSGLTASRRCVILPLLLRHVAGYRKKLHARTTQLAKSIVRKIAEEERIAGDESEAEEFLAQGKLILANAWAIPPRAEETVLRDWTEEGETLRKVSLDPSKTPAQNAERFFARYKKKRSAAERARKILPALYAERDAILEQAALIEFHTELSTLASMGAELLPGKQGSERRGGKSQRQAVLPPYRRFEFPWADASLFVGLSAKGNHYVTFRLAKSDDMWMHAQNIPGAHVILRFGRQPEKEPFEKMLGIAAACAAYHSKGREDTKVRVDYTERRHVRAISGGGLGRVTYREFSTIQIDTDLWSRESGVPSGNPAAPREERSEKR